MIRFLSLLKATISNDLKLFNVKGFRTRGMNRFVAALLSLIFCLCFVGLNLYAYRKLNDPELNYIALVCGLFMCSIVSLAEAIIKSRIILFESKDTQLLLSLPLKPSEIMSAYMCKFLILQILFNLMIYLPTVITYACYTSCDTFFYVAAVFGALLLPIVPSLVGAVVGFAISYFCSMSKKPKKTETAITIIVCIFVLLLFDRMDPLLSKAIAANANGINGVLRSYLPVYTLVQAIMNSDFVYLCIFVSLNTLCIVVMFWGFAKIYYTTLNRKMAQRNGDDKLKMKMYSQRSPLSSLIRVEIKRFFDSPLYVITSLCGLALMVVSCAVIALRYSNIMRKLLGANLILFALVKPYLSFGFLLIMMVGVFLTCISASSITLEGKQLHFNRSLPIKPNLFLISKICASLMIVYPIVAICDAMFFVRFTPDAFSVISVLVASVLIPLLNAQYGLLINLLIPNMSANEDSEGIKYGPNTILVSLSGIALCVLMCLGVFEFSISCKTMIAIANTVFALCCILLHILLKTWGVKRYLEIDEK